MQAKRFHVLDDVVGEAEDRRALDLALRLELGGSSAPISTRPDNVPVTSAAPVPASVSPSGLVPCDQAVSMSSSSTFARFDLAGHARHVVVEIDRDRAGGRLAVNVGDRIDQVDDEVVFEAERRVIVARVGRIVRKGMIELVEQRQRIFAGRGIVDDDLEHDVVGVVGPHRLERAGARIPQ